MNKHFTAYLLLIGLLTGCGDSSSKVEGKKEQAAPTPKINVTAVVNIINERCSSCHSSAPTDDVFKTAPSGVLLETVEQMQQSAARIYARAVASNTMPFMNKTGMTEQERSAVGQWIKAGSPSE